ncbi:MAG: hypothetical protein LBV60_27115 [Streptomyces sp.]|jgi:D-alanyl-D-alanine dipeptidase|nr:hypothetical protein [Streptomyces sp.]
MTRTYWRTWRRQRPYWVCWATLLWAVVYAGFGLACAVNGIPPLHVGAVLGSSALGWAVTAVGVLAALACVLVMRYGPRTAWRVLLGMTCGLAGVAAFGLLMDVITLTFGQGVDSWISAANHAWAATGVLLLARTARYDRSQPVASRAPAASAAPLPVQLAACAGTAAFLPYAAMKLNWATGGTFAGESGADMRAASERNGASRIWLTLESWGLDGTMLLAALGVFLLWGLVRPWGQVFPRWTLFLHNRPVPRWLPLAPALIGAATLAPYGVIGLGYLCLATAGEVTIRRGDFDTRHDALLVSWIGISAFAVYGLALIVATRSYWLRSRRLPRNDVG